MKVSFPLSCIERIFSAPFSMPPSGSNSLNMRPDRVSIVNPTNMLSAGVATHSQPGISHIISMPAHIPLQKSTMPIAPSNDQRKCLSDSLNSMLHLCFAVEMHKLQPFKYFCMGLIFALYLFDYSANFS